MNEKKTILTADELDDIRRKAREKLGECRKTNDVIGEQIFSVLSRYARVIYYPLGENAPWGFTHMNGNSSSASYSKPFVAINTSIPVDCQVFAAAHELYHIWYEKKSDIIPSTVLEDETEKNEIKANRFAAEFLVDPIMLRQEMDIYSIDSARTDIKDILRLAELFSVPYQTIVKRLFEIGIIDERAKEKYLNESEERILEFRKLYSMTIPEADERIAVDNLAELAVKVYEKKLITYEKLEYLLGFNELKPSDVGIEKPLEYDLPSDDELDDIMGE